MNMNTNQLTANLITELSGTHQSPCLSLYQPTHRHHPDNQQDPMRFRGLLKQMRQALHEHHTPDAISTLTEPLESMGRDHDFWNHTLDGLAVFAAPGLFRVIRLPRPVRELAVAADSFHTKPLRRFLQSADRYQVLALSLSEIRLYEGSRDALDPVDLASDVPRTITEALGEELTEPHQTVAAYGGTGEGRSMHHGHGGKKDEVDSDQERFFRAIDRAILEHHSRPAGLPLLLAALSEHHGEFGQISQNPFLLADGIKINPDALSMDQLRQRAWEQFEPQYQARLAKLVEDFAVATSKRLGLEQLAQIAEAAALGRIATLLIEADREIGGGRLDADTGRIERGNLNHPELDDLLDDLGDLVLKKGGRVLVIPAERMPTTTGAAAICRYS
jgi:hypothetical protein